MKLGALFCEKEIVAVNASAWVDIDIEHLALNSKNVQKGSAFFAFVPSDSNFLAFEEAFFAHIKEAIHKGAKVIIFDQPLEKILSKLQENNLGSINDILFIEVKNVRLSLANASHIFYPNIPKTIIAVTGTSGKSSVVSFLRQIWQKTGIKAASIGTLGVEYQDICHYTGLTTPNVLTLYQALTKLNEEGVTHVAIEASSHGIEQHRLDALPLAAAAFTNLGRDHLDYHKNLELYFLAKQRLFQDLLPKHAPAIIFADDVWGQKLAKNLCQNKRNCFLVGENGNFIIIKTIEPLAKGQKLAFIIGDKNYNIFLPLVGKFQAQNALMALALAIKTLETDLEILPFIKALEELGGVKGRLEYVATYKKTIHCYVDYAHKPEALKNLLITMRALTKGRIILVFGCGGNRDKGKRPIMGKIAHDLADITIITDDNPRLEDAAQIREDILKAIPLAHNIGDRYQAIKKALQLAQDQDIVVVAGKGHEEGQIIGMEQFAFSDEEAIHQAIRELS